MFDFLPWMDEVHIVEMGRMFVSGGDANSILLNPDGVLALPIAYICPLIQELAFRLFGQIGVRLSPFLGLVFLWLGFRKLVRDTYAWPRPLIEGVSLLMLMCPLAFQSAAIARADTWPLAFTFAALAILGRPDHERGVLRISFGALLATLSVFSWPSSLVSALVYPAFCFNLNRKREFFVFCLAGFVSAGILALPLLPKAELFVSAFLHHTKDTAATTYTLLGICDPLVREVARSPFLVALGCLGAFVWLKSRRYMAVLALLFASVLCVKTGLYAFRLVYLTPICMLMCADAINYALVKRPRLTQWFVVVSIVYGVVSGPVGQLAVGHSTLPVGLKEYLAKTVGIGPKIVFAPDYATYYIGRELGWQQLGFGNRYCASDKDFVRRIAERSDAAVLCDWNPYEITQRNLTPYGVASICLMSKSREESGRPEDEKSILARIGSQFKGGWQTHAKPECFSVTNRFGMVRVLTRE